MHQLYRLTSSKAENYRTQILVFDQPLAAQPGQFVMVWLPGVGEKPYSITHDDPLTLTVVGVGAFSTALGGLQKGDNIWVRGPFGQGFQLRGEKIALVGGGYGVAPLLFLGQQALSRGLQVDVFIGAGTAQDLLLREYFETAGACVWLATEDGTAGQKGLVTALVDECLPTIKPDWLYACGPVNMLKAVSRLCMTYKLPHQLSWEAHIRCGLGICGDCECEELLLEKQPGWLVCRDGPVQIVTFDQT